MEKAIRRIENVHSHLKETTILKFPFITKFRVEINLQGRDISNNKLRFRGNVEIWIGGSRCHVQTENS
jgi:hypothetical protein